VLRDVVAERRKPPLGSGYVVDSLWSSRHILLSEKDYEGVVKAAIELGDDTDTTACIAGGLAGIHYGYGGIPERWLKSLRGQELLHPLEIRLIESMR
jgi:ADP-ribosyl-[dinitrogen reductase] hydrolase